MSIEKYKAKLEPEALNLSSHEWKEASQTISLKRIADALERLQVAPKQPIMMDAAQYAKYKELKDIPTNVGDIIFNKS